MNEHLRPEELDVSHEDVECLLAINGIARTFSTADSAYWLYPERYKAFNHIVKWHSEIEESEAELWFGVDQDDMDALHEAGITQISAPYPNDTVIAQFWAVEMRDYENEMTFIERTGELPK